MANTPAKKKKAPPRRSTASSRNAERGGLVTASVPQLHAELRRRSLVLVQLRRTRERLVREMAAVDKRIVEFEPAGAPPHRKRPKNTVILLDALRKVLDNHTLSVTQAAGAVTRGGYRTTSENFRTIVNQTLLGNKKAFKKVSRGNYTLRK